VDGKVSVVDELDRLAELRERGRISPAEYDQAKQQLLGASRPAVDAAHGSGLTPDSAYLLYRLITSWLKRVAAAMAVVALLFGIVAGWSGLRYLDMHTQAEAIKEAAIAQGLGVRIPDPRPTIERGVLETKATAYGALTAVTGVIALSTLAGALLIRPPTSHPTTQAAQPQLPTRRSARG
jgi:putative oligomerization/nucleic acid binding protein